MENILQYIIRSARPVYCISPHLDDAVFSAGALIREITKHVPVTIVTVFTECGSVSTLSARRFVRLAGFSSADEFFAARRSEDESAVQSLGASLVHLGYMDAQWRLRDSGFQVGIPELRALYPTYRWHVIKGRISSYDTGLVSTIQSRLGALVPPEAFVLYPAGIGNHVDHMIVHKICSAMPNEKFQWADMPYINRVSASVHEYQKLVCDPVEKQRIAAFYATQFQQVFGQQTHAPTIFSQEYIKA